MERDGCRYGGELERKGIFFSRVIPAIWGGAKHSERATGGDGRAPCYDATRSEGEHGPGGDGWAEFYEGTSSEGVQRLRATGRNGRAPCCEAASSKGRSAHRGRQGETDEERGPRYIFDVSVLTNRLPCRLCLLIYGCVLSIAADVLSCC